MDENINDIQIEELVVKKAIGGKDSSKASVGKSSKLMQSFQSATAEIPDTVEGAQQMAAQL